MCVFKGIAFFFKLLLLLSPKCLHLLLQGLKFSPTSCSFPSLPTGGPDSPGQLSRCPAQGGADQGKPDSQTRSAGSDTLGLSTQREWEHDQAARSLDTWGNHAASLGLGVLVCEMGKISAKRCWGKGKCCDNVGGNTAPL